MGTRGFYVIKYKDIYHTFYNHSNSHPKIEDGLGSRIIDELKKMDLNLIRQLLNNFPKVERNEGNIYFVSLVDAILNPTRYDFSLLQKEPYTDIFVEYIYIVDLDLNLFEIKSNFERHSFSLNSIPDNWRELFQKIT